MSAPGKRSGGCLRPMKWGCGCLVVVLLILLALAVVAFFFLQRVPRSYPPVANPIEPPPLGHQLGGGLDGFASPYLGHTGSWDGKGGAMFGKPKTADLDAEAAMGLRWTFMPVYWRALEPDGPVDLAQGTPPAWQALDAFVMAAQKRKLNVLMQAPVIGGNAGGPPAWAGRREPKKSSPANIDAAAAFAGKLAARYAPGGALSKREGWQQQYGVRAWELDNEPDGYLTHWKGQAADYAEFATKAALAIRQVDPQAVILGPSVIGAGKAPAWIEAALNAPAMRGSPAFRQGGRHYSIGPVLDVVSFHSYEGLDSAFTGKDRTIEVAFSEIRSVFEQWENRAPGFEYARKQDYWHTEGNFDFFGVLSQERRAAWRIQFFTRAFAAGIRKVNVMDASPPEQAAVRAYIRALPNPFPMQRADDRVETLSGRPVVFCHLDNTNPDSGRVWVLWAAASTGAAEVELPAARDQVTTLQVDGTENIVGVTNGSMRIQLRGDKKMAPPVLVIDRPGPGSQSPPDRPTVYAWFPLRFGSRKTDGIQWDCLTHLCFRSVELAADGRIRRVSGNPPREFVDTTRRRGVKVTVLAWARSRADSDSYLARFPQETAENLLAYVKENNLDGVNIDDEQMGETNMVANVPNRELVTRFFQILAKTFKDANPDYHITFASPPVISARDHFGTGWLDLSAIAKVVDGIIPMGYTMNPPSIGWATNPEPLGGGGRAARTTTRDLQTMIKDYLAAMGGQREKLLAGVSLKLGGYEWRCRTDQRLSPTLDKGTWRSLAECEARTHAHGLRWDEGQQSPWYCYPDGDNFVQGWFNDSRAWSAKLDWIKEQGLGGVGIWVLDGVNDPPETWQALRGYTAARNPPVTVSPARSGLNPKDEPRNAR